MVVDGEERVSDDDNDGRSSNSGVPCEEGEMKRGKKRKERKDG